MEAPGGSLSVQRIQDTEPLNTKNYEYFYAIKTIIKVININKFVTLTNYSCLWGISRHFRMTSKQKKQTDAPETTTGNYIFFRFIASYFYLVLNELTTGTSATFTSCFVRFNHSNIFVSLLSTFDVWETRTIAHLWHPFSLRHVHNIDRK